MIPAPELTIDLWRQRLQHHTQDTPYRGRALTKFPEDLRIYQTLIEQSQPEVIIEIGTFQGGSALWFADQLRALTPGGLVITIDINDTPPLDDPDIIAIVGDATNPDTYDLVAELVGGRRCMVIEDSAHTYPVTTAVLRLYPELVTPGQWLVVEDGVIDIDELRLPHWPRGVTPAIEEFLKTPTGQKFTRHFIDRYVLTCHPGGWLQRNP